MHVRTCLCGIASMSMCMHAFSPVNAGETWDQGTGISRRTCIYKNACCVQLHVHVHVGLVQVCCVLILLFLLEKLDSKHCVGILGDGAQ